MHTLSRNKDTCACGFSLFIVTLYASRGFYLQEKKLKKISAKEYI